MSVGEIGITIRKTADIFKELKTAYEAADYYLAEEKLDAAKHNLIVFPTFLNIREQSSTRHQEIILTREILEHGVLLAARMKDLDALERHYHLLTTYYDDLQDPAIPESSIKFLILGLNLLRLLVMSRIAEFHSQLEKIPRANHRNTYILFAVQMERYLMEGSFNKLLHARAQAPSNDFVSVVEMLEGTVRHEVGKCIPAAYTSISRKDATSVMMAKSEDELKGYAERQQWSYNEKTARYEFSNENGEAAKRELPFLQVLKNGIQFAGDLQRVV